MTIKDEPVKHRCEHDWEYNEATNKQVCKKCFRYETPSPQTALVFVSLWENPKVNIVSGKSLGMSKSGKSKRQRDLGGFLLAYRYWS